MFFLHRPTPAELDAFVAAERGGAYSYPDVGASRGRTPAGYAIDRNRVPLGEGAAVFGRAKQAVRDWRMFALGWCAIHPERAPIEEGVTVAAVAHHFGFWSANASRIVYVRDEDDGRVRRYGFAYGTLPAHGAIGEERFSVEWDRADDRVWYDLYAFSRPGHVLARVGYPFARMLQRRFARDSKRAMADAAGRGRV